MRALSWARLAAVVVVGVVVQVAVLDQIVLFGVHPDVMVVIAVGGGFVAGPARGAAIGFFAGLVSDLSVSLPFGLSALTFVLVGYGASYLGTAALGRDFRGVEPVLGAVGAAGATLLYALLGTLIGQSGLFGPALAPAILVVGVGGAVLAVPVCWLLRWVVEPSAGTAGYGIPIGGSAAT